MRDDYDAALQVYASFALHLSTKDIIEQDLHAPLIHAFFAYIITCLQNSVPMFVRVLVSSFVYLQLFEHDQYCAYRLYIMEIRWTVSAVPPRNKMKPARHHCHITSSFIDWQWKSGRTQNLVLQRGGVGCCVRNKATFSRQNLN